MTKLNQKQKDAIQAIQEKLVTKITYEYMSEIGCKDGDEITKIQRNKMLKEIKKRVRISLDQLNN